MIIAIGWPRRNTTTPSIAHAPSPAFQSASLQHWVLREDDGKTKYLEMPDNFAREMVADWCGAGRAITGKWEVWKWYEKNRERIMLHQGKP